VLKDFDVSSFKKMKPPADNTFDAMQEVKELKKIPLNKSFVKKFDNIESAFAKTAKDNNVQDYDKNIAAKLIKDSAPVILELKKYFNRPRPKVSAKKMNLCQNLLTLTCFLCFRSPHVSISRRINLKLSFCS
jgi:hypothetical protein